MGYPFTAGYVQDHRGAVLLQGPSDVLVASQAGQARVGQVGRQRAQGDGHGGERPGHDDGRTVRALDVLVPRIGEIIGGSQREERLDVFDARLEEMGLSKEDYAWYRDLRRYGTVPHAGFGLGFERLVAYVTGMQNVRDVIPFPRTPGSASF